MRRAFPRSRQEFLDASQELSHFEAEIDQLPASLRDRLRDTGIAGTSIYYRFSYDVANWLARKAPKSVSIDWSELQDTAAFDDLLRHILQPSEDEYFDSGYASTALWVQTASASYDGTDFDWLMAQLQERPLRPFIRQLYDAADIPLVWQLRTHQFSKSDNVFRHSKVFMRSDGYRARPTRIKQEIARPISKISRLSRSRGEEMIDVAIASLAVRHRETLHFDFANPHEVYVADVGKGVVVAVFGLLPEFRFPLECTMGYLILSNGVPIGYGGSSILFKQANTGVNLFAEYRGTEAAFLWVQVMRVYHSLFHCTRFIANPYQFGAENTEALKSGAFWFYYKLGYRPVDPAIRQLAIAEEAKRRRRPDYRSDIRVLKRLASCDMHLTLPGARQSEFFDEEWLTTSSQLATERLAKCGGATRKKSALQVVRELAQDLDLQNFRSWTPNQQRGLRTLAPFVASLGASQWTASEKREMQKLLRAKGGQRELAYARLLAENAKFLQALRSCCKRAAAS
jgi:hypothetical protein